MEALLLAPSTPALSAGQSTSGETEAVGGGGRAAVGVAQEMTTGSRRWWM